MQSAGFLFTAGEQDVRALASLEEARYLFTCLPLLRIDAEVRAQLYLLMGHSSLNDAYAAEKLLFQNEDSGQSLAELSSSLVMQLAETAEDDLDELTVNWAESQAAEALDLETEELQDFLFALIELCRTAVNEDAAVYLAN